MSDSTMPAQEPTRWVDLDEVGLRRRLGDWTTGVDGAVVSVKLLQKILDDLDDARERVLRETARREASHDTLRAWGGALLLVARDLGVVVDASSPEQIAGRCVGVAKDLRASKLLLQTLSHWGLG